MDGVFLYALANDTSCQALDVDALQRPTSIAASSLHFTCFLCPLCLCRNTLLLPDTFSLGCRNCSTLAGFNCTPDLYYLSFLHVSATVQVRIDLKCYITQNDTSLNP